MAVEIVDNVFAHSLFTYVWSQDNCLLTLEHLGMQPDLTVLRLERNLIDNFSGVERCPKLKETYLDGNPVEKHRMCNIMACLSMNPGLIKVNGKVLTKQVCNIDIRSCALRTAYLHLRVANAAAA